MYVKATEHGALKQFPLNLTSRQKDNNTNSKTTYVTLI